MLSPLPPFGREKLSNAVVFHKLEAVGEGGTQHRVHIVDADAVVAHRRLDGQKASAGIEKPVLAIESHTQIALEIEVQSVMSTVGSVVDLQEAFVVGQTHLHIDVEIDFCRGDKRAGVTAASANQGVANEFDLLAVAVLRGVHT